MAKVPMTGELKRLHRKFIPGNIIFFLLALVAMLAQIFMPFLDMRIRITGSKLAPLLTDSVQEESADNATQEEVTKTLTDALEDVNFVIPINVKPLAMFKAARGTEADVEAFFNSIVGENGAAEFAKEMVDALAKPVLKAGLHVAIDESLANADLTPEQRETIEQYKDDVDAVVDKLADGSPEDVAEAKTKYVDTMKKIAEEQGGKELTPDELAEIETSFDELVEQGTLEDGSFDVMELLQNIDAQSSESGENSTDEQNGFGKVVEMLENPGKAIMDALKESGTDVKTLQTGLLAVFLVMAGIQAFFWGLFALSCLLHVFTTKKSVRTRYVRLFCVWCGLGVLVGNLAVTYLPDILAAVGNAEASASLITALGAFSIKFGGAGVVTGICWVIMLIVNLFYYRPARKAVKRETKRLAKMLREGYTVDELEDEEAFYKQF